MKKVILLITLLLNSFLTFSQILDCPDYPNPDFAQPPTNIYSRSTQANPPTSNKYVFNIKFHIVKNTDGSGVTANYGENEVMNAILILNTHYNPFNIFFKYRGFDVIKSTLNMRIRSSATSGLPNQNIANPFFADLVQYSKTGMTSPVYDYNAMNLFIVEGIDFNTATPFTPRTAGVAYTPGIDSVFAYNTLLTSTMPHELGHNFNLLHTHQGSGATGCELVNGSNSATAGDLVTDTPASHVLALANVNTASCTYQNTANLADCTGTVYSNVPIKNFMSTNNLCRILGAGYLPGNAVFSLGQGNRMREQIETYYNNANNTYGYSNAKNDIESLYEPFAIVGIGGSTGSSTTAYSKSYTPNETNTGANVWNCPTYTLRFQKGLNWIFSNSTIGTLNKTITDQYNYSINNHLLNVQIPYLSSDIYQSGGIECFSSYEPYIKGDIKSLTNLGSQVIMYETLDEIKAADPNLYEQLQSQEYHIITKETESGFTDQKIIYKN